MSIIEKADDHSLSELLKDHYAIPQFQRPYVWKRNHVTQFFNDLLNAYNAAGTASEYFIGSIVIYYDRRTRRLQLVDGQQRMVTLTLLFAALRDRIAFDEPDADTSLFQAILSGPLRVRGGKAKPQDRLLARSDPDRDILQEVLRGRGPTLSPYDYPAYQRQLVRAYVVLSDLIPQHFIKSPSALGEFAQFLLDNVYLVSIRTDNFTSALQIFETINARGENLSAFDLVKNYLFSLIRERDRDRLQGKWDNITDKIGETVSRSAPSQTSSGIRFLRYFVMASYDTQKVIQAKETYTWIRDTHLKGRKKPEHALEFARDMEIAANTYSRLHNGKYPKTDRKQPYISYINLLNAPVRQHYALLMAAQNHSQVVIDALAQEVERLVVTYLLAGERWNKLESKIPDWAVKIRNCRTQPTMQRFLEDEIGAEINRLHREALQGLRLLGILGSAAQRYILARLTEHVQKEGGKPLKMDHYFNNAEVTIEHILPQNPTGDTIDAFDQVDDLDEYIFALGNLTLLFRVDNSRVGNKPFDRKKTVYAADGHYYLTTSIGRSLATSKSKRIKRLQKKLHSANDWTPRDIEKRTEKMVKLAEEVWKL